MAAIDKVYVKSYEQANQFRNWCSAHMISDKYGVVKPLSYWLYKNIDDRDWFAGPYPVLSAPNPVDYYIIRNCPFDFVQEEMKINYGKKYDEIKNAERYFTDGIGVIDFETYQYLQSYTPGKHFTIKRGKSILITDSGKIPNCNRPYYRKKVAKQNVDFKARDTWNKNHRGYGRGVRMSTQLHQPYWWITIYKDKVTELSDTLRFMMYSEPKQEGRIGTWDTVGDCVICKLKSSDCSDCRTIKALTRRILKWQLPVGTELRVYNLRYPDDDYYKIVIKK